MLLLVFTQRDHVWIERRNLWPVLLRNSDAEAADRTRTVAVTGFGPPLLTLAKPADHEDRPI
jgi:hypothetical protein